MESLANKVAIITGIYIALFFKQNDEAKTTKRFKMSLPTRLVTTKLVK